jgi:hypothetical protein
MKNYLFATITKVDEERREVEGVLAEEARDKENEKMDYATSKPFFEKWNAQFAEKTDGKSVGNLRAMHQKIAAGKFLSMDYDDAQKVIRVIAKVVDDKEWKNVVEGVYTGFSIGARVVGKKWRDTEDGTLRWTADPFEGSLVDNPCMYGASFTAVRADGAQDVIKFVGSEKTREESKGLYAVGFFANVVAMVDDLASGVAFEEELEQDAEGAKVAEQIRQKAKELGELLVQYTANEVSEMNGEGEGKTMKTNSTVPGERPKPVAVPDAPGVRPAAKVDDNAAPAPAAAPAAAAAAAPVAEKKGAKFSAETKSRLSVIAENINALLAEDPEAAAAVTAGAPAEGKEAVASADAEKFVSVEKVKFAAMESELVEKTSALTAANTALETAHKVIEAQNAKLKQPLPTPVKLNGSVVVEKEKDGAAEKSESGAEPVITKDTNPVEAMKLIHAGGAQLSR